MPSARHSPCFRDDVHVTATALSPDRGDHERLPDGFTLHHVETIGSTNDEAARLASIGAPSGTIVLADEQTGGRGRLGRPWRSAPGNLHASFLLRPDCALKAAGQLSLLAGLALSDLLIERGPEELDVKLKWPNDVLIDGAKVAGILLESAADRKGGLAHVIVGIGVNLVWAPDDAPYPVTSLAAAGFAPSSAGTWLCAYAAALSIRLDRWRRDGFAEIRQAWRGRSFGLGSRVRFQLNRRGVDGRLVDLAENGALLVECGDGSRHELTAGDVVFADR